MNILKYKYKAHKLVNSVFYLIIFLVGFLMGLGVKKINFNKLISNFLMINTVHAYTIDSKNEIEFNEEFIYNAFQNWVSKNGTYTIDDFPLQDNGLFSCYVRTDITIWHCDMLITDEIPNYTSSDWNFGSGRLANPYFFIYFDYNFNTSAYTYGGTGSGTAFSFNSIINRATNFSSIEKYNPRYNMDYSPYNKLDFSKYICTGSVCYNKPEEFFEEQGYSKKCTSDSLFMSFSDYKKRFLRIYSYGDLTEKMSGNDKKGYSLIETFPRFSLGKFVFKDGILTRTDDFSTENGENDVIYYDKQYTVDLIKQYQREEISYEQYKLLIDLYDKVFKNYTHLFLEYSLDSDYDKTNQLLYPYLLLGDKSNFPDGYEVCFYYNVKTCDENGKNCVNKNEDLIFTKIKEDGVGGYDTVVENECITTPEGCVNNFHGSSSDYSYDDKSILNSLQNFGNTINMFNKYITDFFFSLNSTLRALILCIFGTILIIIIVKLVVK